ncbi:G-protein coupled receptor 42-like [Cyprinodon tularosa]|uniref:G-protein coupled receptor 42-like n=1 Tax=Cyprinodon tularosa TaxID=77115 RepID=UPI0018E1DA8C|nr:G-protein coupled receptor 42-like [Cyprinodon tularosa]
MSLLAVYSLYSQIRSERVVPVFLINLLISDVLQVVCMVVNLAYDMDTRIKWTNFAYGMDPRTDRMYFIRTYHGFVVASALFMTLITLERYLMIAHPLWYRFNKTAKVSVSVSVATWILSILMSFVSYLFPEAGFLIPLPFMIFFVALTFRALSTAQADSDEAQQIVDETGSSTSKSKDHESP